MAEFDFDSLLEDIDTPVPSVKPKEVKSDKEVEEKVGEVFSKEHVEEALEDIQEPKVTEEQVKEVFHKKAIEEAKDNAKQPDYSDEFADMIGEVKKYFKDVYNIKQEIRELQDQLKERRQEAKEIGIKVTVVDKAMKEVIAQIKETSEDAKYIEDAKRLIESDPDLYAIAASEAN